MRIIYSHCTVTNRSTYEYNVARLRASSRDEQTSTVPVDQSRHYELTKPYATYRDAEEYPTDDTDLTGRGQILRVPTTGRYIVLRRHHATIKMFIACCWRLSRLPVGIWRRIYRSRRQKRYIQRIYNVGSSIVYRLTDIRRKRASSRCWYHVVLTSYNRRCIHVEMRHRHDVDMTSTTKSNVFMESDYRRCIVVETRRRHDFEITSTSKSDNFTTSCHRRCSNL